VARVASVRRRSNRAAGVPGRAPIEPAPTVTITGGTSEWRSGAPPTRGLKRDDQPEEMRASPCCVDAADSIRCRVRPWARLAVKRFTARDDELGGVMHGLQLPEAASGCLAGTPPRGRSRRQLPAARESRKVESYDLGQRPAVRRAFTLFDDNTLDVVVRIGDEGEATVARENHGPVCISHKASTHDIAPVKGQVSMGKRIGPKIGEYRNDG
jgi:hypothetical protein